MKPYQSLVMTGRKSLTTCSILLVIDRNNESLAMVAPFVMSAANLGMHPIRLARVKNRSRLSLSLSVVRNNHVGDA